MSYVNTTLYDGAFAQTSMDADNRGVNDGGSNGYRHLTFNAQNSNAVYGSSSTVQPNALTARYYIKF